MSAPFVAAAGVAVVSLAVALAARTQPRLNRAAVLVLIVSGALAIAFAVVGEVRFQACEDANRELMAEPNPFDPPTLENCDSKRAF